MSMIVSKEETPVAKNEQDSEGEEARSDEELDPEELAKRIDKRDALRRRREMMKSK